MAISTGQVQEMQGLYGPFTLAERVVQKIWMRQDFAAQAARLTDGRGLSVLSVGNWNMLAGPDFRGARLKLGNQDVTGDVEVHFNAADWRAHGHDTDPAYDNVVLHVVMFPPPDCRAAQSRHGVDLPTLVLLPLLNRGLEEYAADDALERLTARDAAERLAELAALPADEMRDRLWKRAHQRWQQKVRYAALRIERLGWREAAHHTALEILGYRHNRPAMLAVAARHPLSRWAKSPDPDAIYAELRDAWQTQGVRPLNHPRRRLHQYAAWVAEVPDWPELGHALLMNEPGSVDSAAKPSDRRALGLTALRARLQGEVTGGVVGGSRLDNLMCDGLLPLVAAQSSRDLSPLWFPWFLGDGPEELRRGLGTLGLAGVGVGPLCHGWAQGLLSWIIDRDAHASS